MAGRPTKLDKKLQTQIVKALRTGAAIEDVCQHVGIARSTFHDWFNRGEEGDPNYSDFSDAITRARASAKLTAIGTLHSAMMPTQTVRRTKHTVTETRQNQWGKEFLYVKTDEDELTVLTPGDWRAAVEYLKRRHGAEWGDKQTNVNYNVDPALMQQFMDVLKTEGLEMSDVVTQFIAHAKRPSESVGRGDMDDAQDADDGE